MNKLIKKLLLAAVLPVTVTGCGVLPEKNPGNIANGLSLLDSFTPAQHRKIADDLLFAMAQIDGLSPLTTTVQLSHAQTPFGRAVQASIINAGYGMQEVEGDLGNNLIRYLAENAETEQGFRTRYRIEVGENYAERNYRIVEGHLVPNSEMRVGGTAADDFIMNDSAFNQEYVDPELSYVTSLESDEPEIRVVGFDRGAFKLDNTKPIEPSSTGLFAAAPIDDSTKTLKVEPVTGKTNMFYTLVSNFAKKFEGYEDNLSGVLVFPNDSLRLGAANKSYIVNLAKTFDPETEIFSVIGCSHGKSAIENGNEILANGRANRVKEALMLAGVGEQYIYDEGCWAPQVFDDVMPRRGVLLTRKQLIKKS